MFIPCLKVIIARPINISILFTATVISSGPDLPCLPLDSCLKLIPIYCLLIWNSSLGLSLRVVDMHCLLCSTNIENAQCYEIGDIGLEITYALEQRLGREVPVDGALCAQCFESIVQELSSPTYTEQEPHAEISPTYTEHEQGGMVALPYEENVCVWCRSSLFQRRSHVLPEGPYRQLVSERISPREIPDGGRVCYACWIHSRRLLEEEGVISAAPPNTDNCVWCQVSLTQRRRHSIPEGPEREEIIQRIYPREIPPGDLVCYACWVSARRNVQRANNPVNRDVLLEPGPMQSHYNVQCAWCRTSLFRRRTHILSGAERDEVAARIYPCELPEHALVCDNCWTQAQQNINISEGVASEAELLSAGSPTMSLDDFSHTTSSSSRCFVPGCLNVERNQVPEYIRKRILNSQKVFVTESARICNEHKSVYNWEFLDQQQFSNTFTKTEMESMLRLSIKETEFFNINFEKYEQIDDNLFKYWTGIDKLKYVHMLNIISPAFGLRDKPKTSLGVFLIKARTGDSHERIASLLDMSKSSVTRLLDKAREALDSLFVPLHLGVNHMTRQDVINRNLVIPKGLFGNREERKPIVICDATYIYLQKSSNYLFQKKTYSLHKYRNLVKPFLLVATDGHIIDVVGPYPATTSDADIMKALFQNENGEFRRFFRENDIFILDRGFRDAIPLLESLGYKVYKPESLEDGESQLPVDRANKSRFVTLCRWVVEVINGRFKRDFRLFRNDYFNLASTHLMKDFRICAAIINAFHPVIVDRPDAHIILNRALARKNLPNQLGEAIISNRINRYRSQFHRIDGNLSELDTFPQMTMSDLIIFALGIYQIKQARSYYGEHIRQHGSFQVEVSNELEVISQAVSSSHETVLVRGCIRSRHHSGRKYFTYVMLARQGQNWEETIAGYYCTCVCGLRTVGCCAHVMTIVWYLGWARYQEQITAPASFLDEILVREDLENE